MTSLRIKGIFTLSCVFITSCAMNDQQRTVAQGAGIGCGIGAVIGQLIGGDSEATALGCVAAGMAGAAYGEHVADQKSQYASKEEHFRAVIDSGRMAADKAKIYNQKVSKQISLVKNEQYSLEKKLRQASANQEEIAAHKRETGLMLTRVKSEIDRLNFEIGKQRQVLAQYQRSVNANLVQASQQQISQLESEQRTLKIALAELKAIDNRRVF